MVDEHVVEDDVHHLVPISDVVADAEVAEAAAAGSGAARRRIAEQPPAVESEEPQFGPSEARAARRALGVLHRGRSAQMGCHASQSL